MTLMTDNRELRKVSLRARSIELSQMTLKASLASFLVFVDRLPYEIIPSLARDSEPVFYPYPYISDYLPNTEKMVSVLLQLFIPQTSLFQ